MYSDTNIMTKIYFLLLLPSVLFGQIVSLGSEPLTELTDYKNTIRWNITPFILFSPKNINIGYERKINDTQTASINIGNLEIPILTSAGDFIEELGGISSKGGISVFADYKFYFLNRNKRVAPEGIYIGPYIGYYSQRLDVSFEYNAGGLFDESIVSLDMGVSIDNFNFGVQLGYQFVFYDRFTVDLIFIGPSYGLYMGTIYANSNINSDVIVESDVYNKFVSDVLVKVPLLKDKIESGAISIHDEKSDFSFNYGSFRYVLQVGYRF